MEIIKVETKEQLKELYNCSAMTWEGLIEEDFETALNMCGAEGAKGYVTTGAVMNKLCKLTGSNAYPDDLTIFSIDKFKGLAMMYGARWMDDIIINNADRQGNRPF
jgi:hypothetical protein